MGEDTITVTSSASDSYVINLNDTYGTTTSYFSNDYTGVIATDIGAVGASYTISTDTISITDLNWNLSIEDTHLEVAEVEKMCGEYPALAKVYENFKTMYDLVKQDWEGKKNAENNS
jgi:hypothetical protein